MTLRELVWAADGRRRHDWDQTALLAAKIHNAFCTERRHLAGVQDFHPYMPRKRREPIQATSTSRVLIETFCTRR